MSLRTDLANATAPGRWRALVRRASASSFLRGVAALSGAQVAATAIPLLAAPVIGRLYTPAQYAPLATFMAFSGVFGTLAVLSFDKAIVAERTERGARALVGLTIAISILVALAALGVALIAFTATAGNGADTVVRPWLLALPFSVVIMGIGLAGTEFAVRGGRFGLIGRRRVAASVVPVGLSIAFGFAGFGADGLIASYLAGQVAATALSVPFFKGIRRTDLMPPRRYAIALARRHRDFAIYQTPSAFSNTMFQQMPVFALTALGALPLLGAFVRARQLVFLPLNLIGQAIGSVFRSHALRALQTTNTFGPLYDRTLLGLFCVAVPSLVVLWLIAPIAFTIYLGPAWTEAGEVARLLAPLLLLRFLSMPLASAFYFAGKQRIAFWYQTAAFVAGAVVICAIVLADGPPYAVLVAYAIVYGVLCTALVVRGRGIAQRPETTRRAGQPGAAVPPPDETAA